MSSDIRVKSRAEMHGLLDTPDELCTLFPNNAVSQQQPISPFTTASDSRQTQTATPNYYFTNHRRSSTVSSTVSSFAADDSTVNMSVNDPQHISDIPVLITPNEIQATAESYHRVLEAAAKYREALTAVSQAAAEFGSSLEECSRCKGAGSSSDGLLAAGGLHYLVSNHKQVLANSIRTSFETPVSEQLRVLKQTADENQSQFKNQVRAKNKQLKQQQKQNQKLARRGVANLSEYRHSLQQLTAQIDDIDRVKHDYYESAFKLSQNTSHRILTHASSIVRAQVEIYEGIARKGWSGGGLDSLISSCPDPFQSGSDSDSESESKWEDDDDDGVLSELPEEGEGKKPHEVRPKLEPVFTVLPAQSILPEFEETNELHTIKSQQSRSTLTPSNLAPEAA